MSPDRSDRLSGDAYAPDRLRPDGNVLTLGDAALDVVVRLDRPLVVDDDVPARIALRPGGQAANVAAWCVALGADAAVVARVGEDAAGAFVRSALDDLGVDLLSPGHAADGSVLRTPVITSLMHDGSRSMCSDRSVAAFHLDPEWFDDCGWLHVSGYELFGPDPTLALEAASLAASAGAPVSVDLSARTVIEAVGAGEAKRRIAAAHGAVVFANESEVAAIGLLEVETLVVKAGSRGARVRQGAGWTEHAALACEEVRDVTGAGDAFAAGFIVGGVELALRAAAECIASVGAMPAQRSLVL